MVLFECKSLDRLLYYSHEFSCGSDVTQNFPWLGGYVYGCCTCDGSTLSEIYA